MCAEAAFAATSGNEAKASLEAGQEAAIWQHKKPPSIARRYVRGHGAQGLQETAPQVFTPSRERAQTATGGRAVIDVKHQLAYQARRGHIEGGGKRPEPPGRALV